MSQRQCHGRHVLLDVWQKLLKQSSGREALCMWCPVCLLQVTSTGRCNLKKGQSVHLCDSSYFSRTSPEHFCFSNRSSRCSSELYSLGWGLVITACTLWDLNLSGVSIICRQQAVKNSLIWVPKTGTMLLLVAALQAENQVPNASLVLDQGLDNFT